VRVKFTLSPTGSSLPPPSSIKELQSHKDCHQAPIRDTSEPYSSSGLLHTRNEFGHNCQVIHRACSILATAPQAAKVRKPLQVFMSHPKKPRLSWILVVVLRPRESRCLTIRLTGQNNCGTIGLYSPEKTPTDRGRRRARARGRGRGSKLRRLKPENPFNRPAP